MSNERLMLPLGQRISLPGHFDVPVVLEDARALGNDGSGGYECRVRLPDGSLDEAVISAAEAQTLLTTSTVPQSTTQPVDAERLRLLIESARIRLAYAHDRQFAVSLWGIRTLPPEAAEAAGTTGKIGEHDSRPASALAGLSAREVA